MEPVPVTDRSTGRPVVTGKPVSCQSNGRTGTGNDRQKSGPVPSLVRVSCCYVFAHCALIITLKGKVVESRVTS